ncbi:hypothetical protein BGZ60DRAFT_391587 [Tricladium varicosporioides]|nr:hypothetical protein BGZ60DRAFT_391587 [Hymenoscyphus varicosporioides]
MQFLVCHLFAVGLLAFTVPSVTGHVTSKSAKLRTVVTTDMEQDDLASLIRYLLYTNDLDTEGIVYSSSRFHWAGDGKGTEFFLPDREYTTPQTSWRWTGTRTMQDIVIPAYAKVYPNLRRHDPFYPTPKEMLAMVKIGNIDFEGEMDHDSEGSDHIRSLLLDKDPRPLYLQAWGGTNTIARALKSIEERFSNNSQQWVRIKDAVSRKAVIIASGFQDNTYDDYIAKSWSKIRVEQLADGYNTWGYNCNLTQGNVRGLPNNQLYFSGHWIKANIQIGPYGKLYRSWLDGQSMPGDPLDTFGNPAKAATSWCRPLNMYDFLSEGDNVAFNPLLTTGIQEPANPNLGGWGGRSEQNTTSPNLWVMASNETSVNGTEIVNYTTDRWIAAIQNDFGARIQWTVTPAYSDGNHAPSVEIRNNHLVQGRPGRTILLASTVSDPDGDKVTTSWWQYVEEGTYPGFVSVTEQDQNKAIVTIPINAKPGQTISIILQGTDDGQFPLTRYDRVFIQVV